MFLLLAGLLAAAPIQKAPPELDKAELGRSALSYLAARGVDGDSETRAAVMAAWGKTGNPAAIPLLKKALNDSDAYVRLEAAASLLALGEKSGAATLKTLALPGGLKTDNDNPVEELRRIVKNKIRAAALRRLIELNGSHISEELKSALKDEDGAMRDTAASGLAYLGHDEYGTRFVEALKDDDETVREAAVRALRRAVRPTFLDPLIHAASDESISVRVAAMDALGRYSDATVLRTLAIGSKDKSQRVRNAAIAALASSPALPSESLKILAQNSLAPGSALRVQAALAIRGLQVDSSLVELGLTQKDPDLKILAVEVLAHIETQAALETLSRVLKGSDEAVVKVAAAAILVKRLQHRGKV